MHQPNLSVWHLLDPQMHHVTKPVQSFNWASSAGTISMPPVISLKLHAAKFEVIGVKVAVPDGSEEC